MHVAANPTLQSAWLRLHNHITAESIYWPSYLSCLQGLRSGACSQEVAAAGGCSQQDGASGADDGQLQPLQSLPVCTQLASLTYKTTQDVAAGALDASAHACSRAGLLQAT